MACQEFTVLYTHQKTKKSKVWQDGILRATVGGNKAILYDERGQVLDSIFMKYKIKPGHDLESDRYLITIESEKVSETGCSDQPNDSEEPKSTKNNLKSFASSSPHLPTGLKRKFMGFKGPRQLEKNTVEEPVAIVSSTSKEPYSSFPSEFYISSPLFSVPCKRKKETYQLPSKKEVFMKNDEDIACVTFPYFEEHKIVLNKNCNADYADAGHLKPVLQMNNGVVKTGYCSSNNGVVSQKMRSKAQILTLLNREQKHSEAPELEDTASLKNLPSTSIKTEFHQEDLSSCEPSRTTDSLFKEKAVPFLGCADNAKKETTKHEQSVYSSEYSMQTKSRWDVYLPSHLAKQTDDTDTDDAECNKDVDDPQTVLKNFQKSGTVNESEHSEDHEIISQPALLGISISPIIESSVKNHPESFVPPECLMSKESDTEAVSSFVNIHYSECVGVSKTLEETHRRSDDIMTDNLEAFCNQSQNKSSPGISLSAGPVCGDIHDQTQQFIEVNFNLLETLDFSDTEAGELPGNGMILQGPPCFKDEPKIKFEVSVQKNHEEKSCSDSGHDKHPLKFLQNKEVNCIPGSQSLQLCHEICEMPNRIEENSAILHFLKESGHSEATTVDKKSDANSTIIQNLSHHGDLACIDSDLLVESDMPCEVIDNEYLNQTTGLQKTNTLPHVIASSSSCFMDKYNEKCREVREHNAKPVVISDNIKPINSLLTVTEKYKSSDSFPQCTPSNHSASERNNELDFKPVSQAFTCKILDQSLVSKIELENRADVLDCSYKTNEENEKDSFKPSVDSLSLSPLANGFRLINSLTKHSTALEMIEEMSEENTGILFQRDELTEKHELTRPEGC